MIASSKLEGSITGLLTVGILALSIAMVKREFFGTRHADHPPPGVFVENWRRLESIGIRSGEAEAPITVIEFLDFQCPKCRLSHSITKRLKQRLGNKLRHVSIHYPLKSHVHARSAAIAAECAQQFERYDEFAEVLFGKQDSLGVKPWHSIAAEAGIRDSSAFAACLTDTVLQTRIDAGLLAGEEVGVQGTPTLIVNGWLYHGALSYSVLNGIIDDLLRGKSPEGAIKPAPAQPDSVSRNNSVGTADISRSPLKAIHRPIGSSHNTTSVKIRAEFEDVTPENVRTSQKAYSPIQLEQSSHQEIRTIEPFVLDVADAALIPEDNVGLWSDGDLFFQRVTQVQLGDLIGSTSSYPDDVADFDLTELHSMVFLSDSRFVTLSSPRAQLHFFNDRGRPLYKLGSIGQGPGQFLRVSNIVRIAADTLLVLDRGNNRVSWLREGEFLRSSTLSGGLPATTGELVAVYRDGSLLISSSSAGEVPRGLPSRTELELFLVSGGHAPMKVVSVPHTLLQMVETTVKRPGGNRTTWRPALVRFSDRAHWVQWDTLIVIKSGDANHLSILNRNGKQVSTIVLAIRRKPVTRADRDSLIALELASLEANRERPIDPEESRRLVRSAPFADSLPLISGLFVSSDNLLWVVDAISPASTGWNATAYNRNGTIVKRLSYLGKGTPMAFGSDRVALRVADEDGLVAVEIRRVVPK